MRRLLPTLFALTTFGMIAVGHAADLPVEPFTGECALVGEALAEKVATTLLQRPEYASSVGNFASSCSCEQAVAIAQGVVRAAKVLQVSNPASLKPMYLALKSSCSTCSANSDLPSTKGPVTDEPVYGKRCERPEPTAQADALKIRAPRSTDCYCSALSSLAAQANARTGDRFGYFPDEGAFGGGGVFNPLGQLGVTRN